MCSCVPAVQTYARRVFGIATRLRRADAGALFIGGVRLVSSATLPGSGGAPTTCGQDIPGTGFLTTDQYNAHQRIPTTPALIPRKVESLLLRQFVENLPAKRTTLPLRSSSYSNNKVRSSVRG